MCIYQWPHRTDRPHRPTGYRGCSRRSRSYRRNGSYRSDLSAADSTLNIPLKDLILTYQRASASALRISIAPKNTAAPVLVDLRRTTIYDGSTIETQTLNGSSISASIAIDGTMYTNSQETHNMCIRQQDPVTKLWSMCEINSFLSAGGARCSIRIQWSEYDVVYAAPTV